MSETKASWFYNSDGKNRKGPFNEEQMSALLIAGAVNEHTKVWSEKIADWTPLFHTDLRKLLGEKTIEPPGIASELPRASTSVPPIAAPVSYRIYDNRLVGKLLYWALWVCFVPTAIGGYMLFKAWSDDQLRFGALTLLESEGFVVFYGITSLPALILWLVWKYRATATAHTIAGPQSVTPAGAIYWYFVPIMWFWKPYEAMKNLHSAFLGNENYEKVISWWGTFWGVIGISIVVAALLPANVTAASNLTSYYWWNVVLVGLEGAQISAAIVLIKEITTAETATMEQLGKSQPVPTA